MTMLSGTFLTGLSVLLAAVGGAKASSRDRHGHDWSFECSDGDICYNGGTCSFKVYNITVCECPEPYFGWQCEYYDACHDDPCQNGGICDYDYFTNGYYCACQEGWTGQNCQIASHTTSCADIRCEHGGTCFHYNTSFFCFCRRRYFGYFCEVLDDHLCDAETAPCANGGTCRDDSHGIKYCDCTEGWAGDNCTLPAPVASLCNGYCENAGSCNISDGYEPTCLCAPGWTGEHCSEPLPPPPALTDTPTTGQPCDVRPSPCGDNGRCVPDEVFGGFTCHCYPGWQGELCREPSQATWPDTVPTSTRPTTICDIGENLCGDNGRCVPDYSRYSGYRCVCTTGWQGVYCTDSVLDSREDAPQSSSPIGGIVGASVGSLVLFFVIFGAVFVFNLARTSKNRRARPALSAPAPLPSVIYDPGVHDDFCGRASLIQPKPSKDVYSDSDRYQQALMARRYNPAPVRDHPHQGMPSSSSVVRNPAAGAHSYDYAYEPGPSRSRIESPLRAPIPMSEIERGHEYAYVMDDNLYEASPRSHLGYAKNSKSVPPTVTTAPPAYSRSPSRAPSKAPSEHTYQSISEYNDPPSSPASKGGPAPSVKSVGSHHSSKK
ncbi:neurogenic locus notch homolog protein 1-like [Acanthaster planci]|uniref:Neurogenic locus notch homolog protein 1-like n=1 Tax=Acanthaster planci TaxID=133434 RepID=A0A8B7YT21_ACAPL|nr:neurogenic locus notch homolog protein 1-like [Acanthaster planci]